jgi:hypothetical protein
MGAQTFVQSTFLPILKLLQLSFLINSNDVIRLFRVNFNGALGQNLELMLLEPMLLEQSFLEQTRC